VFNILSIDWGEKNPGMAFGDPVSGLIIPFSGKLENKNLIEVILKEIKNRSIKKIILGKPLNSRGGITEVTHRVLRFKKELEKLISKEIKIQFQDERWTSKEGLKIGFSKENLNHFSAVKILERYLER